MCGFAFCVGLPISVTHGLCCSAFICGLLCLSVCLPSSVTTGKCGCSFDPLWVPLPLCLAWFGLVLVLDPDFVRDEWARLYLCFELMFNNQ